MRRSAFTVALLAVLLVATGSADAQRSFQAPTRSAITRRAEVRDASRAGNVLGRAVLPARGRAQVASAPRATQRSVRPVSRSAIPRAEARRAMAGLSPAERAQLSKRGMVSRADWPRLRRYFVERAVAANPGLDRALSAFTPGETVRLLNHPVIRDWHGQMATFRVPRSARIVAFVPCAKTKPWLDATRGIYRSYNQLRAEHPDVYFVTVSEPLGVVPQDHWGDFPQYDNPGLFRDPAQRSGMFASDWREMFGAESTLRTPFDERAYNTSIDRLSSVIRTFVDANRRPGLRFVSFVEDQPFRAGRTTVGTHSDMLSRARVVADGDRHLKRGAAREEPYGHLSRVLRSLSR